MNNREGWRRISAPKAKLEKTLMAKQDTFKVSKKGTEPVEVTALLPESVEDARWGELGVTAEQINNLATQSLVIKMQAGARNHLDGGPQKVQEFIDGYKFNERTGGGSRKPTLSADVVKKAAFTPEQIEALRAAGISIPGDETPTPEAAPAESGKKGR